MVQHYYRNVHAVIFVYDVTKLSSFENLPTWVDECDRHSLSSNVPRVLVANKCDITDRRVVSTNMGQKFAEHNDMPFFETSAKSSEVGESVSNIFLYIAKKLKAQRPHLHLRAGFGGISGSGRTSVRKLRLKSSGLRGFEPEKTPKSKCAGGCFSWERFPLGFNLLNLIEFRVIFFFFLFKFSFVRVSSCLCHRWVYCT